MTDPRYSELAKVLVNHSCRVADDERVLVEATDIPPEFTAELVREIAAAGGRPLVMTYHQTIQRALLKHLSEPQVRFMAEVDRARMEQVQAYIALRGSFNIAELSDVPREQMDMWEKLYVHPVHMEVRIPKTKWVVLRWPTSSMAQAAGTSTEAFEDFYFRVCAGVNYANMAGAMQPLVELMDRTDRVRITGPGTDLRFSKKGIPTRGCAGDHNIPDGEAFSCPVRDSVNGTVQYNTETLYRGTIFNSCRLEFKSGKVVSAEADSEENTRKLNEILDSDEGARYVGEFALGFNPDILRPMKDILFDEKIAGSFHFTPGQAYPVYGNGNKSQIHWDMVCIQRPEYGGGEIWFDDVLIRKDGLFVLPELQGLNPERLGAQD
jgi:aminopeptidase